MSGLILEQSELAQWQKLVIDSQIECQIELPESIESYLTMMLSRYVKNSNVAHFALGRKLLSAFAQDHSKSHISLQMVGDQALLIAGLFPGRAERFRVNIEYYIEIGQTAYKHLSSNRHAYSRAVFHELCYYFDQIIDVLSAMRPVDPKKQALELCNILHAVESPRVAKLLQAQFGNIVISRDRLFSKKH